MEVPEEQNPQSNSRDNPAFVEESVQEPPQSENVPDSAPEKVLHFSDGVMKESKDKAKKIPRRILHFSDGVIEEYSTDEEEEEEIRRQEEEEKKKSLVDPKTLTWMPWLWYLAWYTGSSALAVCDTVGEKFAWWLGITSPKYYYEIQEYKRQMQQEEERRKRQDAEMAGWRPEEAAGTEPVQLDPSSLCRPEVGMGEITETGQTDQSKTEAEEDGRGDAEKTN